MTIHTLIPDIYDTVKRRDGWFTAELADDFARGVSRRIQEQFKEPTEPPRLRLSKMGPMCPKALWHSIHTPHLAEALPPWATIKYSYGHMIEALAIVLAKASGHRVEGEQDELIVDDVSGHRDCVIDGCLVDVKSTTSHYIKKFQDKTIAQSDTFGYLSQLDGYLVGCANDPMVTVKDRAYLFGIDKQLGHMALYEHRLREEQIRARIKEHKRIVELDRPPECTCGTAPYGESGNIALDVKASYNAFKYCCFPNLRTFIYSDGPVYLTKVVKRPKPHVMEVDRYGNQIYSY